MKQNEREELEEAAEARCAKFSPHPKSMHCDCCWCVGRADGETLFKDGAKWQAQRQAEPKAPPESMRESVEARFPLPDSDPLLTLPLAQYVRDKRDAALYGASLHEGLLREARDTIKSVWENGVCAGDLKEAVKTTLAKLQKAMGET